jgi:hypothetical protein
MLLEKGVHRERGAIVVRSGQQQVAALCPNAKAFGAEFARPGSDNHQCSTGLLAGGMDGEAGARDFAQVCGEFGGRLPLCCRRAVRHNNRRCRAAVARQRHGRGRLGRQGKAEQGCNQFHGEVIAAARRREPVR